MMTLKMRMMRGQSWNWSKGLLVRIHRNWRGRERSTLILLSFTLGSRAGRTGVSPPDPGASKRVSSGRGLGVLLFRLLLPDFFFFSCLLQHQQRMQG